MTLFRGGRLYRERRPRHWRYGPPAQDEMPPRPQPPRFPAARQDGGMGPLAAEFDPCGAPPIAVSDTKGGAS